MQSEQVLLGRSEVVDVGQRLVHEAADAIAAQRGHDSVERSHGARGRKLRAGEQAPERQATVGDDLPAVARGRKSRERAAVGEHHERCVAEAIGVVVHVRPLEHEMPSPCGENEAVPILARGVLVALDRQLGAQSPSATATPKPVAP